MRVHGPHLRSQDTHRFRRRHHIDLLCLGQMERPCNLHNWSHLRHTCHSDLERWARGLPHRNQRIRCSQRRHHIGRIQLPRLEHLGSPCKLRCGQRRFRTRRGQPFRRRPEHNLLVWSLGTRQHSLLWRSIHKPHHTLLSPHHCIVLCSLLSPRLHMHLRNR